MGMTTTPIHPTLSPHKERRNQDFFLVMACGAMDLRDLKSGISRELRELGREFWEAVVPGFPASSRKIPAFPADFPIHNSTKPTAAVGVSGKNSRFPAPR